MSESLYLGRVQGVSSGAYLFPLVEKGPGENYSGAIFFLCLPAEIPRRRFNVSGFLCRIHLRRLRVIRRAFPINGAGMRQYLELPVDLVRELAQVPYEHPAFDVFPRAFRDSPI